MPVSTSPRPSAISACTAVSNIGISQGSSIGAWRCQLQLAFRLVVGAPLTLAITIPSRTRFTLDHDPNASSTDSAAIR